MRTHVRAAWRDLPRPARMPQLRGAPAAASLMAGLVTGVVARRAGVRGLGDGQQNTRRIATEQAAMRRVTTLAVRGVTAEKIFDAVAAEMGHIIGADYMVMCRFRADKRAVVVASWSARGEDWRLVPIGSVWTPAPGTISEQILRTGRAARTIYTPEHMEREGISTRASREHPLRSGVGCPIMVEGRRWGVLITLTAGVSPPPADVEERMAGFLQIVAAAIANVESRAELTASRARLVAAADASRRRIERDLRDTAQRRIAELTREAHATAATLTPGDEALRSHLAELTDELAGLLDDLRTITRGMHPAALSHGGLGPALAILAERSAVRAECHVRLRGRLPAPVEAAGYNVVSEALTNTAKYARASRVRIEARVEVTEGSAAYGRVLRLVISDDGSGGADVGGGSGLLGLRDRVEALGGRFDVSSPAGQGTTLTARIPIAGDGSSPPPRDG